MSATFKTEVDFKEVSRPIVSAPAGVASSSTAKPVIANLVALRETFLAEAPFVNRSNKLFWSKWIECKEYVQMLSSAIVYVQQCISEGGTVNLDKLNDITDSSHVVDMSSNLADMFFLQNPRERDVFFNRLPEVLCFMIVHSLHIWNGRNYRVYNSGRFRELLLDFLNELICGLRPTDSKRNSQWIFQDAVDTHIATTSLNTSLSSSQEALQRRTGGNLSKLASAQSTYTIGHSPLISAHLGVQTQKHPLQNCVKLTLCHMPTRPLMCLTDSDLLKNVRERKITADMIKSTMLNSQLRKTELKRSYLQTKAAIKADKTLFRKSLKTTLDVLDNKPVSNKRLLAAMSSNASVGSANSDSSITINAADASALINSGLLSSSNSVGGSISGIIGGGNGGLGGVANADSASVGGGSVGRVSMRLSMLQPAPLSHSTSSVGSASK
jgi:hypothetical protein